MIYSMKLNIVILNYCLCENKWFKLLTLAHASRHLRAAGSCCGRPAMLCQQDISSLGSQDPLLQVLICRLKERRNKILQYIKIRPNNNLQTKQT